MNIRRKITLLTAFIAGVTAAMGADVPFVDHSRDVELLDFDLHGLVGGSIVTQNYSSCFPQVSEMDLTMGISGGLGAAARANFTRFVAIGMEINFLVNQYSLDMAVADDNGTSITNVFARNRYMALNFPVYCRLSFNPASTVRWHIDIGGYYSYGLTGRSRTSLYVAQINPVGQLVTTMTGYRVDYFNNSQTFINSSYRGDYGLHLGTSLTFHNRVTVGLRGQIGIKNVANAFDAVVRPNVHNCNIHLILGWHFR